MQAVIIKMIIDFMVKIIMSFISKQKAIESPDGVPDQAILDDIKAVLIDQLGQAFAELKKEAKEFIESSDLLNEEKLLEIALNAITQGKETDYIPYVPSSLELVLIKTALKAGIRLLVASLKKVLG
jgi:hypothetical protein